ncbi:hypothetical protein CLTEP_07010 [Clostridium tepidiprofundi DSM 19306]|uniref:Uncharacterized protein n=1 Tax=Clostridium tepidiprofundi DSM 19306 TaxID=1121338 RepID=A0A151B6M4_9CLOT|nr:DUF3990 domain-containing protein [Clostridium tepidiprofundi]KYH35297.1 hypothetical protein CLTEP_07010 [Clostridium tepidiprofundi DSM 19306]
MLKVYHGSSVEVKKPELVKTVFNKDFGLSSSEVQPKFGCTSEEVDKWRQKC